MIWRSNVVFEQAHSDFVLPADLSRRGDLGPEYLASKVILFEAGDSYY